MALVIDFLFYEIFFFFENKGKNKTKQKTKQNKTNKKQKKTKQNKTKQNKKKGKMQCLSKEKLFCCQTTQKIIIKNNNKDNSQNTEM